jgi:hypothetical protein
MALTQTFGELNLTNPTAHLELSPRRRLKIAGTPTSLPATTITTVQTNLALQDVLTFNDGLMLEMISQNAAVGGVDPLPIVGYASFIVNNPITNVIIELGTPQFTITTFLQTLSFVVLPALQVYSAVDLDRWALQAGLPSIFTAGQQPLVINTRISINNTTAAAIANFTLALSAAYRVVHGMNEG